jgi:inner membrane protein
LDEFFAPLAIQFLSRLTLALWDESLHLITGLLFLAGLRPSLARPFVCGAVAGSVLIDIDHLPAEFGSTLIGGQVTRPVSHSLTTIVVLLLVAVAIRGRGRVLIVGVAFGVATHLFRDMATGGLALWWPLSSSLVTVSYRDYALTMVVMLCLAVYQFWSIRMRRNDQNGSGVNPI